MKLILWTFLICSVQMVKHEEFKTCVQSSFCTRQRAFADLVDISNDNSPYKVVPSSIDLKNGIVSFEVLNWKENILFSASLNLLDIGAVRFRMKEKQPLHQRYEGVADFSIIDKLENNQKAKFENSNNAFFAYTNGNTIRIQYDPFTIEVNTKNGKVFTLNGRGYLHYEHYREKSQDESSPPQDNDLKKLLVKDSWDESFNGKPDSKPKGPSSIGIDISFIGSENVYGIPEHASDVSLKSTRGQNKAYEEPYRLYNLDVFEYILDSPMALYGSIPYILSHKKSQSVGFLWVNSAEMWVDVEKLSIDGKPSTSLHWSAESGIIDMFVMTGATPQEVQHQLKAITGAPAMPQMFATSYHQCRWNYNDEQDVEEVDNGFDKHKIPYDVLWLDIEHTDGKRYFTWDNSKFPDPAKMQSLLSVKGRKMVTIIDPHIKADSGFEVSKQASELDLFVKDKEGRTYEGWCWPGNSNWLDYTNPAAREYWSKLFLFDKYKGSTPTLYTWNDMNEPSVFTGPEITMLKDNLHFNKVEHRDVHNVYGMLQHRATFEGHLLRSQSKDRPFVLSRAFFIGTQRYGAIWTGDNFARWDHLQASVPMLLSLGISGLPFVGADVGGFFGNPEPELLVRWYQTGAFQPFFRAHAHIDTKRREPWLFGEENTNLIRKAVQQRYFNLPYIYTLHFEAHQTGNPIMRPMFYEFSDDVNTYAIDDQFMLGSSFLVKPVTTPGNIASKLYLPKGLWYHYYSYEQITPDSNGHVTIATPKDQTPVLIRGGSIIARKERLRRSSELMKFDPYTLLIALDENGSAKGRLYVDDGKTYDHESGKYILTDFNFSDSTLSSEPQEIPSWKGPLRGKMNEISKRIEKVVIIGFKSLKKQASVEVDGHVVYTTSVKSKSFAKKNGKYVLVVKDPKVLIHEKWKINL